MTHLERARLFYSKNDEGQPIDIVAVLGLPIATRAFNNLATAFGELETEAFKRGFNSACASLSVPSMFIRTEPKSESVLPITLPMGGIVKRPGYASGIHLANEMDQYALSILKSAESHAWRSKSCTCGAQSVKSRIHSNWCDKAGEPK